MIRPTMFEKLDWFSVPKYCPCAHSQASPTFSNSRFGGPGFREIGTGIPPETCSVLTHGSIYTRFGDCLRSPQFAAISKRQHWSFRRRTSLHQCLTGSWMLEIACVGRESAEYTKESVSCRRLLDPSTCCTSPAHVPRSHSIGTTKQRFRLAITLSTV
jgi:hypothetical protein